MVQVFVSYAREDRPVAHRLADLVQAEGYSVWWDRELGPGEAYSEVIEAELDAAQAVIVLWSATSRKSHWVRDEAAVGRDRNRLVPVSLDAAAPPLGFRQIHTLEISAVEADETARRSLMARLAALCGGREPPASSRPEQSSDTAIATQPNNKPLHQVLSEERRQRRFIRTFWIASLALLALAMLPLLVVSRYLAAGDGLQGLAVMFGALFVPGAIALIAGRFFIVVGRRLSKRKSTRYFDGPTNVTLGASIVAGLLVLLLQAERGQTSFFATPVEVDPLNIGAVLSAVAVCALAFPMLGAISMPIGFIRGLTRNTFEEGR